MKQIKFLITTVVLALVLASCGRNDNNADVQNTPTATPQQTQGVVDDMGNAVKDVTNGVGEGMKDMGNAVKNTTK